MNSQEKIQKIIEALSSLSESHLNQLYRTLYPCAHKNITRSKSKLSAVCEDCQAHLGWACPTSPDQTCHYYSEEVNGKRIITLIDGSSHELPSDHESDHETEDDCLFCHLPDERK